MDDITEEIEHQEFMAEMRRLQELIFWCSNDLNFSEGVAMYDDIAKYGTEPVFAALLFDKLLEEEKSRESNR